MTDYVGSGAPRDSSYDRRDSEYRSHHDYRRKSDARDYEYARRDDDHRRYEERDYDRRYYQRRDDDERRPRRDYDYDYHRRDDRYDRRDYDRRDYDRRDYDRRDRRNDRRDGGFDRRERGRGGPPICRDFQRGKCERENCRFLHETNPFTKPKKNGACYDFLKGSCTRENCRFVHDMNAKIDVCRDFSMGKCTRGDACRFSHDVTPDYCPKVSVQQEDAEVRINCPHPLSSHSVSKCISPNSLPTSSHIPPRSIL